MIKWIKNGTAGDKTWLGQLVLAGEYYEIQFHEELKWANDSSILTDIGSGDAVVAKDDSGSKDISNVNAAIKYLQDGLPFEVVTKRETDTIRTSLVKAKASVNNSSEAVISVTVPGTFDGVDPYISDGRFIEGGEAWFDSHASEDAIIKIEVIDTLDKLGQGTGTVIATYHDTGVPEDNQGWYIPRKVEIISIKAMAMFGFLPSEMDLKMTAKKGNSATTGTLFVNIKWGKRI